MCFSAGASFAVSGALALTGGIAMKRATTRPQRVLAAIPLMFSVQQAFEGMLWLSLCNGGSYSWQQAAMYMYLVFAWMFWPIHIPVSVMLLEPDPVRRRRLRWNVAGGVFVAIALGIILLFNDIHAEAASHHIAYIHHTSFPVIFVIGLAYMAATVIAPFMTSLKNFHLIGIINLIAVFIGVIWFKNYFISVWCYFAAALSLLTLWVIIDMNRKSSV